MDINQAIMTIEKNRPTSGYIMLREALDIAIAALRAQAEAEANEPLTVDELQGMAGEPVWYQLKDGRKGYGLVAVEEFGKKVYVVSINGFTFTAYSYGDPNEHIGAKLYRHEQKEGEK